MESSVYLNIGNAKNLKNVADRILYRFLEILPGLISWSLILFATFFSFISPLVVVIFIIVFDIYWLFKVIYLSIHQVSSYFRLRKNLKTNWENEIEKFPEWKEIFHIICLPFFKEGKMIVEDSILSIKNVRYPKDRMIIVLAVEERGGEGAMRIAQEMKEKYEKDFFKFFISIHPANIKDEVQGKGANVNWALKNIKKVIDTFGIKEENILFSVFDIDTKPYPDYFLVVTYNFLKLNKSKRFAFQPIPIYNNNIWEAPSFSRVVCTSNTFWQMIQQERPEQLVTFSSHTLPYSIFNIVEYPREVVSDDSRIFWKAYFAFDSKFQTVPIFYPVSMDAVLGKNLFSTILNQYRQQRRWAWGVENIPFLIFNFIKNKRIPPFKKLTQSIIGLDGFCSWATASLLIFFLGWFPVIAGRSKLKNMYLGVNLPYVTQKLMILASIGILVCGFLSFLLLPPQKKWSKKISILLQWILLPVTLVVFGCIPALEAQTRLLLGKYMGFWTTEKYRRQ